MVISDGIPAVLRNRKLSEFCSDMLRILYLWTETEANFRNFVLEDFAEERTARNSVPWNKNLSKLSEFCSEAFCGRKNALNSVPPPPRPYPPPPQWGEDYSKLVFKNYWASLRYGQIIYLLFWLFCKTNFFLGIPYRSELKNWLFRGPRNEHFLPRNDKNHSESILCNYFGTKFRCQPYKRQCNEMENKRHNVGP